MTDHEGKIQTQPIDRGTEVTAAIGRMTGWLGSFPAILGATRVISDDDDRVRRKAVESGKHGLAQRASARAGRESAGAGKASSGAGQP